MADHFYRVNAKYGEDATIQSGIRKGTITSDDESLIREYLNEKNRVNFWRESYVHCDGPCFVVAANHDKHVNHF